MEGFVILMVIGVFVIARFTTRHPQGSGAIAKGIFGSIFRK
jgi:hypothetical protein